MKTVIYILLVLILLAMWGIEDAVREGNLSEAEKTQIMKQKQTEKLADEYMEEQRLEKNSLLLKQSWNDTKENDKAEWIIANAIDSIWVRLFFIFFIVISFGLTMTRRLSTG